jgi:hypothetical protein
MPTLMRCDPLESGLGPRLIGTALNRRRVEGPTRRASEYEPRSAAFGVRQVIEQVIAEDGRDRHPPLARPRLQLDFALLGIPSAFNMDYASGQVDRLNSKGL